MRIFMLAALAASLTACGSNPEPPAEAEATETPVVEVSAEDAAAYRDRIASATLKDIASIRLAAPSEELRAEAKVCMDKLNSGAESCATEE